MDGTRSDGTRFTGESPAYPPALIIMVGPPGTGKSHMVRLLSKRVPVEVVETDRIRHQLTPQPNYTQQENRRVFLLAHRSIDRLLREGKDVVVDATNIYESGRRALYRIGSRAGARLLVVRTTAPDNVVSERLRRRMEGTNPADRSDADWDVYRRMKDEMQGIRRPHLLVDTSRGLDATLDWIAAFLNRKAAA